MRDPAASLRQGYPWGATYRSPAIHEGDDYVALSPCHQRRVRVEQRGDDDATYLVTRCPQCSRLWEIRFIRDEHGPLAEWLS